MQGCDMFFVFVFFRNNMNRLTVDYTLIDSEGGGWPRDNIVQQLISIEYSY